ncbi:DMT family transporter [Mesonia maritima]|uniref:Drug/metabolite transporter (DMT)-like permease n=1 Tax=Mesonia maritima TaxID=1793873 RepID=A0ABU1K211_9FLAO|nr:DMT family transporter [Mesonia maritima]MDR6299641.1 drug/metabolite transporter (DMT)-like permease [Mesonia maritima]
MKNSALKGGILVALGASCYGVLTTFVKLAYQENFTPYEVTFAQLLLGYLGLVVLDFALKRGSSAKRKVKPTRKNIIQLILAGTSLGLTSIFYYLAVQFISVSIGIVLLMQSVWMGVVLDAILSKKFPTLLKSISVLIIISGTLLATNVFFEQITLDLTGVLLGLLAAASYTVTIYTSNRVALNLSSISRSKWMMLGGLLIVVLLTTHNLVEQFNAEIFLKWGPILALLGAVLPPILLTSGMPKINVGLGVIITAIELPVAVLMAYFILDERVVFSQWIGILLILLSIVVMNLRKVKKG